MHRHVAVAHRTAVLLGAGPDADDVVQESLVKAYRALGSFRHGAAFRPWLLRIVANQTYNLHRSARRREAREPHHWPVEVVVDPADAALSTERRTELVAALRRLPEPYRRVVICRYLLDLDVRETATVLGWRTGTVKSRLSRALRRLQALLDQPGVRQEVTRG